MASVNKFAVLLKRIRESKGLTYEQVGGLLLTSEGVQAFEEGKALPGIPHKIALMMGLGIKPKSDEYERFQKAWREAHYDAHVTPSRGLVFLE